MSGYEIKEFYGEDTLDYKRLCCTMFKNKNEGFRNPDEYKLQLAEDDKKRGEDFFRLGAFYDGKIYAGVEGNDFVVTFEGKPCRLSGISRVVSHYDPPFKGAMKQIFARAFEIMREQGQCISHLYPFEESYYRQYGYEVTAQGSTWYIPIEKINAKRSGKTVYYDGSEKMQNDIKEVFEKFSSDKNMMILRSNKDWNNFFADRIAYTVPNIYVHYNNDNVPDAFMEYKLEPNKDRPQDMVINYLWYTCIDGLKGILSYFSTQHSYCDKVVLSLPANMDISAFINSTGGWGKRDTERVTKNRGASRAVDVEEVLKIVNIKGEGQVCIKIVDDTYAPWNNDCFTVTFGNERTVTRGGTPYIEMNINAFSSGIFGRYALADLNIFDSVKIYSNQENLEKVFYIKENWTELHF